MVPQALVLTRTPTLTRTRIRARNRARCLLEHCGTMQASDGAATLTLPLILTPTLTRTRTRTLTQASDGAVTLTLPLILTPTLTRTRTLTLAGDGGVNPSLTLTPIRIPTLTRTRTLTYKRRPAMARRRRRRVGAWPPLRSSRRPAWRGSQRGHRTRRTRSSRCAAPVARHAGSRAALRWRARRGARRRWRRVVH